MRTQVVELMGKRRRQLGWTQRDLASALGSSPSRISKMEAGDGTVSLDLLVRALVSMGLSLVVTADDLHDPMADPTLSPTQRALLSRAMLARCRARQIASRHGVNADDVRHVLTNLELSPLQRLGSMFRRAGLRRLAVH